MSRKIYTVITIILIVTAIIVGAVFYVIHQAEAPSQGSSTSAAGNGTTTASTTMPDTSGWNTYTNAQYGISLKYPADWQKSNDPLDTVTPYVFFGDPLSGTTTYSLKLFAYNNPDKLSAAEYVAQMLANDAAEDASNSAAGPGPQMTPQFASQYATTVAGYPAYELYSVFEFDHNAEQVYVADGGAMLLFDFPMAEANPNIASSSANNAIAHAMLGTLTMNSQ